ncbi:MAG: type II secretion system protein [Pseudomonadota bacterium]
MKRAGKIYINQHGFTVIELVVVLILLAIFATVVVSRFGSTGAELITNTDILKSNLRYAQIKAMNDTETWGINFSSSTTYTLYRNGIKAVNPFYLPAEDNNNPAGDPLIHTLTGNVTITSGVGTTISFNEWGTPVDGSGVPLSADVTITLSDGSQTIDITITKNTGCIL